MYLPAWSFLSQSVCRSQNNTITVQKDFLDIWCVGVLLNFVCRSQWPRDLRRRSASARLLGSWVRIPPGAWMFVCCVLSGRGLCDGMVSSQEKSYRLWCVIVCYPESSWMRRPWPTWGLSRQNKLYFAWTFPLRSGHGPRRRPTCSSISISHGTPL
jgi:hypothetical protein